MIAPHSIGRSIQIDAQPSQPLTTTPTPTHDPIDRSIARTRGALESHRTLRARIAKGIASPTCTWACLPLLTQLIHPQLTAQIAPAHQTMATTVIPDNATITTDGGAGDNDKGKDAGKSGGVFLTPESQAFLALAFPPGCPPQRAIPVATGRATMETTIRRYGGPYPSLRRVEDLTLPCLDGQGRFPIRVYWPSLPESPDSPALPVLLYAHGGGWVKGSANTHDQLCRRLALAAGHVVVAVDYRLSPEARFPQALGDLEAAFEWVQEGQPGMDPTRLSVAGDSAGGNLVAGLVVRLLGRGDALPAARRVKKQALIYPVLDLTSGSGDSYQLYGEGFGLSNASIAYYVESYLGGGYSRDQATNPEASPLFFAGGERGGELPPTLLVSARADPLLSDAEVGA